jgi:hypothetical protein
MNDPDNSVKVEHWPPIIFLALNDSSLVAVDVPTCLERDLLWKLKKRKPYKNSLVLKIVPRARISWTAQNWALDFRNGPVLTTFIDTGSNCAF